MNKKDLISVKNLTISSADKKILNEFSFRLKEGSIHAIIGGSGSGKSTFSYTVLGLIDPSLDFSFDKYNLIDYNYKDISSKDWRNLRGKDICLIPQNPSNAFHPYLTLKTQLKDTFSQKNIQISSAELENLLNVFGFKDPKFTLSQKPTQLSGGERQRIVLSIAYKMSPKILVADEPTTALDPKNEKNVLDLMLKMVSEKNISLILVTHDRRIVKELADEITVLQNGKIMDNFYLNHFHNLKLNTYTIKLLS
jgi:ABC-type dipeptide/oligopeptide/nickel transport system ATPase component